jgi:hypothetical protein
MALKTPIAAALGLLVIGYISYPFVTLYRLEAAVQHGDTKTLRRLVDWPQVRQGIEADLARQRRDELPLFGASFIRKIVVTNAVTPTAVCAAIREMRAAKGEGDMIRSGWLEGPGTLMLDLGKVRLRMTLEGATWHVTRVWLPSSVLAAATDGGNDG